MSPASLDEAVRLKQAGRLDEAVIALEGVLSQAPASFPALIQLAEVQLRRDRLAEAAAVLGPCLLAEPEDQYVFSSYVSIQRERGALDELRATLEAALPRAGRRQGAYFGAIRKLPVADRQPVPAVPDAPEVPGTAGGADPRGG